MEYLEKTSLDLKVEERFGKIIHKFKVLHHCWEIDNYGYVVCDGIKNIIVTSDHGRLTVTTSDFLRYKIDEYEKVIEDTKEAIKISYNGTYE